MRGLLTICVNMRNARISSRYKVTVEKEYVFNGLNADILREEGVAESAEDVLRRCLLLADRFEHSGVHFATA